MLIVVWGPKVSLYVLGGVVPPARALRFQHSNLCLLVQNQATADSTPIVPVDDSALADYARARRVAAE